MGLLPLNNFFFLALYNLKLLKG
jgi:hypothetical protein